VMRHADAGQAGADDDHIEVGSARSLTRSA
jgi:hypothetical protein